MTAGESWLEIYPLWPLQLLEKFKNEIEIEVSAMQKLDTDFQKFYFQSTRISIETPINSSADVFNALSPNSKTAQYMRQFTFAGNQLFFKRGALDWAVPGGGRRAIDLSENPAIYTAGYMLVSPIEYSKTVNYDSRIFSAPGVSIRYVETSGWYTVGYNRANFTVKDVQPMVNFQFSGSPYSGVASLVALVENGITVKNFDYETAREFLTFKKSYENYAQQIKSAFALDQANGLSQVNTLKNDLAQKLDQEKQAMQNTRLQITVANQNAIQSAQRDYTQMLLTAQTLKNSLLLLGR